MTNSKDRQETNGISILLLGALLTGSGAVVADPPPVAKRLEGWNLINLPTGHDEHLNISGIAMNKDQTLMLVGSDEQSHIQILSKSGDREFTLVEDGNFALADQETEIDIEGIARKGKKYWVIGSHSVKRKRIKSPDELIEKDKEKKADGKTLKDNYNHKRMEKVVKEPIREWLYRVKVKNNGEVDEDSVVRGSLRKIFDEHPVLKLFREIPSKENGIDIEGLAVVPDSGNSGDAELLIGLRGPTLRGPRAVVLLLKAEKEGSKLHLELKKTLYLALDGRGIRGIGEMKEKEDGYLVLAGPVGDEPVPYMLYHWNGKDTIPEINDLQAEDNTQPICKIPPPVDHPRAKAEGVHFLRKQGEDVEFVVVYDSGPNAAATVFSCNPNPS